MQERVQLRAAEILQVGPLHPAVAPQAGQQIRDRLAAAHRGDQEDRPLGGQVPEQGQRGGVEHGRVVGDGHHAAALMAFVKGPAGLLEQRDGVDLPVGSGLAEPGGQQAGHRAQRQRHGGPAAGHMLGRVTAGRRPLEALVGQPRLPDPGGAVYQQAGALARAKGRFENFQLRATADEGPPRQRDRHSSQHDSSARIYKPARPGHAVTTAGRRPPTIPTMWSDRWRGTPSPSRVAYRWAAARSKWAPVMPSPWWAAAMSGPR